MTDDDDRSASLVGTGLALGVGLGATVAALSGINVASGAGFGISGGIIVAAVVELVDRRGVDPFLPVSAAASALVGAGVGVVGAWTHDVVLVNGALVGVVPGVVLGGFLAWIARRG